MSELTVEISWTTKKTVVERWDKYNGRNLYSRLSFHEDMLDAPTARKFANSLVQHITYVREAGKMIGVDVEQLACHDDSKWSYEEFPFYARNFHGDPHDTDATGIADGFARAWLHHIHHNPHHWQHWIFPDDFTPRHSSVENGVVRMPDNYALEMIADWMGASMAYTGSWDMINWLADNLPKITVHSKTAELLRGSLDMLGYADVVFGQRFAHETQSP